MDLLNPLDSDVFTTNPALKLRSPKIILYIEENIKETIDLEPENAQYEVWIPVSKKEI